MKLAHIQGLTLAFAFATASAVSALPHQPVSLLGPTKKLVSSQPVAGEALGDAVALHGDLALVGVPNASVSFNSDGKALIFERHFGGLEQWAEIKTLVAADATEWSDFGRAVAITGSVAAVGAPSVDDSGAVYIYDRFFPVTDAWGQSKKLSGTTQSSFGEALALQGDLLVVGAPTEVIEGVETGSVSVFGRHHGGFSQWGLIKKLLPSEAGAFSGFGRSIALDGDTILVGAPHTGLAGEVYIFKRNVGGPDAWGEVKILRANQLSGANFGAAVALDGDTALIGAPFDRLGPNVIGSAYIFERHLGGTEQWGERSKIVSPAPDFEDRFGEAVALGGDRASIAAPWAHGIRGRVLTFGRHQGGNHAWGQEDEPWVADLVAGDRFGSALAVHEGNLLVGTPRDSQFGSNAGAAYIFIGPLFADGFESGDLSAWSQTSP